jgi:signal transduction histidine kinase/ActR/RegA family two-component response regulator
VQAVATIADRHALRAASARAGQLQREQAVLKASNLELLDSVIREQDARLHAREEYADHLEREVAIRGADLQRALEHAQSASEAKTQFLANTSHELRTPLSAILGFTDLAIEDSWGRPKVLDNLSAVRRNGLHLLEIVNDLLDVSALESNQLHVRRAPCVPEGILTEAIEALRVRAGEKSLVLEVVRQEPWPQTLTTDPLRLRQILSNLVGNAIKFTERGSVRVEARVTREPDLLEICVSDTGRGIEPAQLARLFQPFAQCDASSSRAFGGTGLGLCIARRLARLLGGDVTVASQPGRGSSFTLTVAAEPLDFTPPLALPGRSAGATSRDRQEAETPGAAAQPALPPAREAPQPRRAGRILVVEDMPDNRLLVTLLLRSAHYEVAEAENGQLALTKALAAEETDPFDLVLMDMQMPVMDGYTATRELRTKGFKRPIVALTAHAMAADRERCLAAGCDGYQSKPLDPAGLLSAIARFVKQERQPQRAPGAAA